MSPKPDNPARLFDRFLIALTVMGALIALIELSEFSIQGNLIAASGKVELKVHHGGSVTHNPMLEGRPSTSDLNSGGSAILNLGDLGEGTYVWDGYRHHCGRRLGGI